MGASLGHHCAFAPSLSEDEVQKDGGMGGGGGVGRLRRPTASNLGTQNGVIFGWMSKQILGRR